MAIPYVKVKRSINVGMEPGEKFLIKIFKEEPVDLDDLLDGLTLSRLNEVFQEIMKRQNYKIDPVRSAFGKIQKTILLPLKLYLLME